MNILIRKLIFNEADIHLILWRDRPCFLVSELSNALDCVNKDDIPTFLRNGSNAIKGMHYDVIIGPDAKELKQDLEDSGIKKKFVQTMVVYFDGLKKYFNFRRTIEIKDFNDYLLKCKISLEDESEFRIDTAEAYEVISPPLAVQISQVQQAPVVTAAAAVVQSKVEKTKKNTSAATPEKEPTVAAKTKAAANKGKTAVSAQDKGSSYSEFLKHIKFMEEFVDAFNKLNIAPENSVAFTKEMVKFLEDNGIQAFDMVKMLKKWL